MTHTCSDKKLQYCLLLEKMSVFCVELLRKPNSLNFNKLNKNKNLQNYQGKVIEGMLVMRKVENVPTGPNHKPKIPVFAYFLKISL